MLRTKLRKDIRAVQRGKPVAHPKGSEAAPYHTYGGDTVLRIPEDSLDDPGIMRQAQSQVAKIYFAADQYEEGDRREFISGEIHKHFGSEALRGVGG
jgi:hypothetical protein